MGCQNDNWINASWLKPAFSEIYCVLKYDSLFVCFYGFTQADKFILVWKSARFRIFEHLVWRKRYASSAGFVARCHEAAYLLAKWRPSRPHIILPSTLEW